LFESFETFETFESFGSFPFCSSSHHEGLMASTRLTKLEAVTFIRHVVEWAHAMVAAGRAHWSGGKPQRPSTPPARIKGKKTVSDAVPGFAAATHTFDAHWAKFVVVEVTDALYKDAGELAERYGLRGYDSIHLASFLDVAASGRR
jgi:predicted nucleic acid-binding protein